MAITFIIFVLQTFVFKMYLRLLTGIFTQCLCKVGSSLRSVPVARAGWSGPVWSVPAHVGVSKTVMVYGLTRLIIPATKLYTEITTGELLRFLCYATAYFYLSLTLVPINERTHYISDIFYHWLRP